ncbi:GNAT family N-acetyltransferase [Streptomyces silvisoli]|uniref:GNAT family N-acetyltransferase n=1 Tax=Streptomyces silvisoli TaxID=3034235 RepID=A0ABT5ZX47_9ACTN|nr:GNAT family N-acetyltransferase [Streptomyces silvisoli]MDF3294408.1 GNAT family N-acetyltransferase [Streptomyces silvisoli]
MTAILNAEATVTTPALKLRPWEAKDVDALVAAHRDPEMCRWLTTTVTSIAGARRWIHEQSQDWSTGRRFSFAVLEHESEQKGINLPIGHVVVKPLIGSDDPAAEVGYWISAVARGRGIAPRALDVVSRWALGPRSPLLLERLDLIHAVGNRASCRVAEKSNYLLSSVLPPQPPDFPSEGHLHVRMDSAPCAVPQPGGS